MGVNLKSTAAAFGSRISDEGMLATLLRHRRYILANALEDLRQRYAGTGLGILWNIAQPLALIAIFSLVFSQIMPTQFQARGGQTQSFLLFLCSGLLPWMAFVDCLSRVTGAFVDNAGYLRKLAIPELVFAARTAVTSTITLAIYLGLLFLTGTLLGHMPMWAWLMMPLAGLLMIAFAFGLGLALGTLNVFLRDVAQLVAVVTQLWMWLSPIVYSVEILPATVQRLVWLNPFYPFVEIMRSAFLYGQMGQPLSWLLAIAWSSLAVILGWRVLRSLGAELRDVL